MSTIAAPLRCGRISYTNDLPVYAAFDLGVMEFPGLLRAGVPTELNRALLDGELDVSPVSSFFYYQQQDSLRRLNDVCIGSRREVKSIYCISERHPRELAGATIAVTRDSSTGRALFDTICRAWYGFTPKLVDAGDSFKSYRGGGGPCLLIGDAAIDAALAVPREHAHDIGLLWHELTGESMIYAVWAARKSVVEQRGDDVAAVGRALVESLRWSEAHIDRVVGAAQATRPRPAGFYESYYQSLNYHLDGGAASGLARFAVLAAEHGVLKVAKLADIASPAAAKA